MNFFTLLLDIHNGKVKQIAGGSLTDVQDQASGILYLSRCIFLCRII